VVERLREIVVGAEQEAAHAVVSLDPLRRDEHDRQRRAVGLAQRPTQLVARTVGQDDVKNGAGEELRAHDLGGLALGRREDDQEPGALQRVRNGLGRPMIVLGDKNRAARYVQV
jgi:hypothetical protein